MCAEPQHQLRGSYFLYFQGGADYENRKVSDALEVDFSPRTQLQTTPTFENKVVQVRGKLEKEAGGGPAKWFLYVTETNQISVLNVSVADYNSLVPPDTYIPPTPTVVPPASGGGTGGGNNGSSGTTRTGAVCRDGTTSNATGQGACSHHGGVDHWLTK